MPGSDAFERPKLFSRAAISSTRTQNFLLLTRPAVCAQGISKAAGAPVMNPTHYAWPTTVLLAQLQPGTGNLPSTYIAQAEGFLNQWVCQGRVRPSPRISGSRGFDCSQLTLPGGGRPAWHASQACTLQH